VPGDVDCVGGPVNGLPKRLTQDEAAQQAVGYLMSEFGAGETIAQYVDDVEAYGERHQCQVWPSEWSSKTAPSVKADFESWCWGTGWTARW
jgi:hypothetical protein